MLSAAKNPCIEDETASHMDSSLRSAWHRRCLL